MFCPRWALASSLKLDNEGELSGHSRSSLAFHSFNKIYEICEYSVSKDSRIPWNTAYQYEKWLGIILDIGTLKNWIGMIVTLIKMSRNKMLVDRLFIYYLKLIGLLVE